MAGSSIRRRRILLTGWRRRLGTLLAIVVAASLSAVAVLAVHDTGAFQLDGNAVTSLQSSPPASDDWENVCHQVSPTSCPSGTDTIGGGGASAVSWVPE